MSWHRLYRPTQIKSLHLSNIRQSLLDFMKKGQIPQVMLFAGPRGTGKTSSARIIGAILNDEVNAKMVDFQFFGGKKPKIASYQEPDDQQSFNQQIFQGQSFLVQEMDAASNRGIDDIRELKERVALPPQAGKMMVYILDEAHMLTTQAFNALLKILEEPPRHAVFILATTELHKIPDTIKSRCSTLHFRRASHEEITQVLESVLAAEKIKFDSAALDLIAQRADGSFRDGVKLLEMVAAEGQVSLEKVEQLLSSSLTQEISELLSAVLDKDDTQVVTVFEELRSRQIDEQFFLTSLLNFLHQSLLQHLEIKPGKPFASREVVEFLLKELARMVVIESAIAHLSLELKLLEIIGRSKVNKSNSTTSSPSVKKNLEATPKKAKVTKESATLRPSGDSRLLLTHWSDLLRAVKEKNMTVEALLRSAKPVSGENGSAKIQVFYKFHKEQLEHPKFRQLILDCASPIAGGEVIIEYLLASPPSQADLSQDSVSNELAVLAEEALV